MLKILLFNGKKYVLIIANAETSEIMTITAHDITISKMSRENIPDFGTDLVHGFCEIGFEMIYDEKITSKIDAILAS